MSEDEVKKTFSKNLTYYLSLNNKTQKDLVDYTGISSSTVSNWCTGQKMPRMDKIQSIANWLGLELSDLLESRTNKQQRTYYLNDEARQAAQDYSENKELKMLFDAARDVSKEDLILVHEMLKRMKDKERE